MASSEKKSRALYYLIYSRLVDSSVNTAAGTHRSHTSVQKNERAYLPQVTQKYTFLQPQERANLKKIPVPSQ